MSDTAKTIALIKAIGGGGGGGSSGGGVLIANDVNGVLDKKWSELLASSVPIVICKRLESAKYWSFVTAIFNDDGEYNVSVVDNSEQAVNYYIAESEDGYPSLDNSL